jgi:hypothetical protein
MTWERELFGVLEDLEGEAEGLFAAEREVELADRAAAEYRSVTLASRLMASLGSQVGLTLTGVGTVRGELRRVGPDWCLLAGARQEWVVRLAAVGSVRGAAPRSYPEEAWSPVDRLGLQSALRRLASGAQRCVLRDVDGGAHEVVLRRIGADFLETVDGRLFGFPILAAMQSREDVSG